MFKSMDTDNSGTITFEELKAGLPKLGTKLSEDEVRQLMEAVSCSLILSLVNLILFEFFKLASYLPRYCISAMIINPLSLFNLSAFLSV